METPLADPDGPFDGCRGFSVPPQVLRALKKAGSDACSTAGNYTLDQGTTGVNRTLNELDAAGVLHAGSYRTRAASQVPCDQHRKRAGGVHLGGLRFQRRRARPAVAGEHIDIDAIKTKARAARKAAAPTWSSSRSTPATSTQSTANGQQRSTAGGLALADPDIDLVYGHHAHVVQPMEKINGKWAVYGLGNNIAAQLGSAPSVQQACSSGFSSVRTQPGNGRPATWRGWPPTRTSAPRTGGAP